MKCPICKDKAQIIKTTVPYVDWNGKVRKRKAFIAECCAIIFLAHPKAKFPYTLED